MIPYCYIRSSSFGCHYICEHKFYLDYIIGIKSPSNEKASLGSAYHRGMELLSRRKLAEQNNETMVDCEDIGIIPIDQITKDWAIIKGFECYREREQPQWDTKELSLLKKWFFEALDYMGGIYNPLNQNTLAIEQIFDIEIPYDWGIYNYKVGDNILEGRLHIKGTMDLLVEENDSTIMLIDFKTGRRGDINTGKDKEIEDFEKDFQVNLYAYATRRLYPQYKNVLFTMFYNNFGGPFTVGFDESQTQKAELMIKNHFEKVKHTITPKLRKHDWFCYNNVCSHYREKYPGSDKSRCYFFRDEIRSKGISKVTEEYANLKIIQTYQDGGGRKAKDNV